VTQRTRIFSPGSSRCARRRSSVATGDHRGIAERRVGPRLEAAVLAAGLITG
jgi:hypothetical protein